MSGRLRAIAGGIRDRLDGYRHPTRHERALRLVRERRPERILFVCLGNVCRSPFAAALAGDRGFSSDSVGFIGPGRHPPAEAIDAARRMGIDHADHVSREIDEEAVRGADLVVVFDRFNLRRVRSAYPDARRKTVWLGDLDPVWSGKRAVVDPWGRDPAFFDATFERIERCVDELRSAVPAE